MMLGQTMRTVIVGLMIGGAVAVAVSRVVQAGYYGVVGIDSVAFAGATLLFLGVMLIAAAVPALRASRAAPSAILKDG
jgi:ABC-type antimicrobial peptide transport system permease subunit